MTWGEFKGALERQGVNDDDTVAGIDVQYPYKYPDGTLSFGFVRYGDSDVMISEVKRA